MKGMDLRRSHTFLCTTALVAMVLFAIVAETTAAKIDLSPDQPSGSLVGSQITWTASDSLSGVKQYRFSIQRPGGSKMIVRDFDIYNCFQWTPLDEGKYFVSVTVRDAVSKESWSATRPYFVRSRVIGKHPVVSPTQHPLVALYSIPPRGFANKVRVLFRPKGAEHWQSTPYKPCRGFRSVNFLVAGMTADTTYELCHEMTLMNGETVTSPPLPFRTGTPEIPVWNFTTTYGPESGTSRQDGVILHALLFGGEGENFGISCPVATDLFGKMIWYYKEPRDLSQYAGSFLMSFPPSVSGTLLIPMARPPVPDIVPFPVRGQLLREIDLAGNTVRETNVDRINEQLVAMGFDPIYYFHHDARYLPNGHILVMAGVEKVLENVQGKALVDVVGDMVIDLDTNLQVVWAWSTFGHDELPISRRALRDEECVGEPMNVCGPLRLLGPGPGQAPVAHDWTHGNTVTYTPADGNIILSFRHQDWVIKVDYADGKGSGKILWRLGEAGDFDVQQALPSVAPDPHPWFSAQHQPMIYARNELVVYDNSNARNDQDPSANSRGQVFVLDEEAKTATLVMNADLGVYASFLGSAQKLANGNYHFLSGGIAGDQPAPVPGFPAGLSESTETDSEGAIVYTLQAPDQTTYRSFRMKSMYRPAGIPGDVDGDSDVDSMDLALIMGGLNQTTVSPYDPRDVDGDGRITFKDLQQAKTQCTMLACKELRWFSPVLGY